MLRDEIERKIIQKKKLEKRLKSTQANLQSQ
jgi:hypothetical protein